MKSKEETYYQILLVSEDASSEEIQNAYELAIETFKSDSLATYSLYSEEENNQILKDITEAYKTLIDPVTRIQYDRTLEQKPTPLPTKHSSKDPENFYMFSDNIPSSKGFRPFFNEHFQGQASSRKGFAELINEHLTERFVNRKAIAQKNRDSQEEVRNFLTTIESYNGAVLQKVRELKKIEMKEVSKEVCIRQLYLSAIENEEFSKLPAAAIYVKSFVTNYARCLELPTQKVVTDYLRLYHSWKNPF